MVMTRGWDEDRDESVLPNWMFDEHGELIGEDEFEDEEEFRART